MTGATLYLIACGLKNRVLRWFMRLRQPRYIAGAVLAGLYLWSFVFRHRARIAITVGSGPMNGLLVLTITAIALTMIVGAWAMPNESPGFVFSEAEIQFLFPAPWSRRQLLAYKLLRSQVGLLFTSAIMSFFAFRGSRYFGMWVSLAALNVYLMFVAFACARLRLIGVGWLTRLAAVFTIFIVLVGTIFWQLRGNERLLLNAFSQGKIAIAATAISTAVQKPPLGPLLFVPRLFGETVYAPTMATAMQNGSILLVAAVLLFLVTVRLDVSFEDASIVASQRALVRRGRMRAMRAGTNMASVRRFPPPFRLADRGRPEVAVFWKNLIAAMRISSFPALALVMAVAFAAAASIFRGYGELAASLGIAGLVTAAGFALLGPRLVRSDLRLDLLRLDVVKTFPLSAEGLLAAELAAPLVIVSGVALLMLIVSFVVLSSSVTHPSFVTSPEFMICGFVFVIPVVAIQLLIQNGAMILFPAWTINSDDTRGLSAMGQRMLFLLGNLVTLLIALLPAAAVLFGSFMGLTALIGKSPAPILIAVTAAAAILVGEITIGHRLLAGQFEDIDIANDFENVTI